MKIRTQKTSRYYLDTKRYQYAQFYYDKLNTWFMIISAFKQRYTKMFTGISHLSQVQKNKIQNSNVKLFLQRYIMKKSLGLKDQRGKDVKNFAFSHVKLKIHGCMHKICLISL